MRGDSPSQAAGEWRGESAAVVGRRPYDARGWVDAAVKTAQVRSSVEVATRIKPPPFPGLDCAVTNLAVWPHVPIKGTSGELAISAARAHRDREVRWPCARGTNCVVRADYRPVGQR